MEEISRVISILKEKHMTITFAESLTCGLAASTLGSFEGVSQIFHGSFVTYSEIFKEKIGVDSEIIEKYGVVSKECAIAMAKASKALSQSDCALSFTGVAGPKELEGNPVGTVWIGLATPERLQSKCFHFKGDRNEIREQSVLAGFLWLEKSLMI